MGSFLAHREINRRNQLQAPLSLPAIECFNLFHDRGVSMGLTDRRKTAKNLVDSRKN